MALRQDQTECKVVGIYWLNCINGPIKQLNQLKYQFMVGKIFNPYNPTQPILLTALKCMLYIYIYIYIYIIGLFNLSWILGLSSNFFSLIYYGTLRLNFDQIEILKFEY